MILAPKRNALNNSLIGVLSAFAGAMLLQSYKPILPLTIYILLVILFVGAIAFSILFGKEFTAALGIFAFSIVIRLMYFVSTRFEVFAYGDAYSQYSVLRYFSQTSHVSIFLNPNFLNFLTRIPHQYSEWPGFEVFSLALSRITGLPLFWTALTVPFILYTVWFVISYALLRIIFRNFKANASKLTLLSIAIAAAFPTFEQPPEFKYDFMAALLLLALILLLIHSWEQRIFEKSVLLVILTLAIVVTHSLTALFLILIVALLGIAFVIRALIPVLIPWSKRWSLFAGSVSKGRFPLLGFFLFVLGSVAVWWIYYASFVAKYGLSHSQFLFTSFSFKFLSLAAGGVRKASAVRGLTPSWLLELLHFRDDLLLGLVAIGTLLLFIRPRILGARLLIPATLLSVAVVAAVTEVSHVLNFGDRSFLTFAPLLACLAIMPVAAVASRRWNLAKLGGILILVVFLFSVGLGFWGSSYAPTFLYSSRETAYAFGEHPTNWPQVASFMSYSTGVSNNSSPSCILTNEVWVTSLVLPVQELKSAYPFTNIRERPGCIALIYQTLLYFNSSSISSEPYVPYKNTTLLPAFSYAKFSNVLYNESDLVFDGGNDTIYYILK